MDEKLTTRAAQAARHVHRFLRNALLWTSVAATAALAVLVTSSVFGRTLFGAPVPDDVVLSEGVLIATVMLPLAAVQAQDAHIRVELLGSSGGRLTRIAHAFGYMIGALLFLALGYAALKDTVELFARAEFYQGVLRVPVWPSKGLFAMGALLLSLELAISVFHPPATGDHSRLGEMD